MIKSKSNADNLGIERRLGNGALAQRPVTSVFGKRLLRSGMCAGSLGAFFMSTQAYAQWLVDPAGVTGAACTPANPCPTVAEAVAVSSAGDDITIAPGVYNEVDVEIPWDLELVGAGVGVTIIDGQYLDRLYTVTAGASLVIRNMSLTGGNAQPNDGGGVFVEEGRLMLVDSELFENVGNQGGAVSCGGDCTQLLVRRSTFTGNAASGRGGAVHTQASTTVEGSDFELNSGFAGGAIDASEDVMIRDSQFDNNEADSTGGAVSSQGESNSLDIYRASFVGNTADDAGAIYFENLADPASAFIRNVTFSENSAIFAGAIHTLGATLDVLVNNSTFVDNSDNLGAADIAFGGSFQLRNSLLTHPNRGGNSCLSNVTAGWSNLLDDSSCGASAAFWLGAHPAGLLGPLGYHNGGRTQSYPTLLGSPAIGAGGPSCQVRDQNRQVRPGGGVCTVGSYEY